MVDLENEGQTHLCMTFRISGCKHHTNMIFVSNIFEACDIDNFEIIHVFQTFTLELNVIHISPMTLLISGFMPAIDPILVSIQTFAMSRISENPESVT